MITFTLFIFNQQLRSDRKIGNLAIITPPITDVDRYSVPNIAYGEMMRSADAVYGYDIDSEYYRVYKNRQSGSGGFNKLPFETIANTKNVIFANRSIGDESLLNQYLYGMRTPASLRDMKYCEISLTGMTNIELYFSVLNGYGETE